MKLWNRVLSVRGLMAALCALAMVPAMAVAQQAAPGLSDVPVSDMSIAEAEKEMATITEAYNRKGHQIKQMALGTLLRFYPQRSCRVVRLSPMFATVWTITGLILKTIRGTFLDRMRNRH